MGTAEDGVTFGEATGPAAAGVGGPGAWNFSSGTGGGGDNEAEGPLSATDFYTGPGTGTFGPGGINDLSVGETAYGNAMNAGPFDRTAASLDRRGIWEKFTDKAIGTLRNPSTMMKAFAALAPGPVGLLVAAGTKMGAMQKDFMSQDMFGKNFDSLGLPQQATVQEAYNAYQAAAQAKDSATVGQDQDYDFASGSTSGAGATASSPNAFALNLITPSRPGALSRRPTLPSGASASASTGGNALQAPRIII